MALRRIVLALVVLSWACGSDDDDADDVSIADAGPDACPGVAPCGPPAECPNYIASDESCGECTKAWGSGASYCADTCASDENCAGRVNPWAAEDLALVCHPGGYCTRPCAGDEECYLGAHDTYECDPAGACSFCLDCL